MLLRKSRKNTVAVLDYIYQKKKKSMYKWTCIVQTRVGQDQLQFNYFLEATRKNCNIYFLGGPHEFLSKGNLKISLRRTMHISINHIYTINNIWLVM